MKEDNTPTVIARRREKSSKQRLRAQNAKKIPSLVERVEKKEEKEYNKTEQVEEYKARWGKARSWGKEKDFVEGAQGNKQRISMNALATPKPSTAKHKKRQLNKSWLPTHLFHTKRAHMTPPMRPLWRFAIPLTPTQKNHRTAHRASTLRGCIAWDASYMNTLVLEGEEESLLYSLRAIGIDEPFLSGKKGLKWRAGNRSISAWIREQGNRHMWIAKVLIIWERKDDSQRRRRILLRVQPSAFLQTWELLLKVKELKNPQISIEDLRFEIGSIDIVGPASMEALVGVLRPTLLADEDSNHAQESAARLWSNMGALTDSFALPIGAMLSMSVADPRLGAPHRSLEKPQLMLNEDVLRLTSEWSAEGCSTHFSVMDRQVRYNASRYLPSQRSINKRKGEAPPGQQPMPLPADPRIPFMLLANNHDRKGCAQGFWTVLLPWKCVLPVWYSLMRYPLSGGGEPRFGGLNEQRQISFENNKPWFPADFPGTKAGLEWETQERKKRKNEWERKPKGRRVEFEGLDLGRGRKGEIGKGWACDWEYLFALANESHIPDQARQSCATSETLHNISPAFGLCHVRQPSISSIDIPAHGLATVVLNLSQRGIPTSCARIYRLPVHNPDLRSAWIALTTQSHRAGTKKPVHPSIPSRKRVAREMNSAQQASDMITARRPALAAALLNHAGHTEPLETRVADPPYPPIPDAEDLVGFVTTGNFNMGEGRGTGIGAVAWCKMLEGGGIEKVGAKGGENDHLTGWCVVREAGSTIGRLGRWKTAE